ncbi:MAG: DUF420 domain-containing protein [Planctomycetes bacterium]|nr:DUF420 domain-containing protein [Planctomycetota bacterium]
MSRIIATLLLLAFALPVAAQDKKPQESPYTRLDSPLRVGEFNLGERSGERVRDLDLAGKVWIVQFFYPGCNRCIKTAPAMKRLQEIYRGKNDVGLLSIDLWTEKIETLQDYSAYCEADARQWLMLTGPKAKVYSVVRDSFHTLVAANPEPTAGDMVLHRTDIWLVDAKGFMVGYADGAPEGAADTLKEEIDRLRTRRRLEERIPVAGADLPRFNALLNSTCTILLLLGWIAIRLRYETLHKIAMLLALAVSMVFLASYLFFHFVVMEMEPTRFRGEGAIRYVYFTILLSHTILAIVVAPMAITITVQGLRNALAAHVKLARWTLPIWLYVSVTGVAVYWMLYRVEW